MSTERRTHWSLTINNPTSADDENINQARQKGWKVDGQLEKGKNGTPHYQLVVKTPQVRFSAVKKQFPRAHLTATRNIAAAEQYVHKEETRLAELPTQDSMYPSLQKLWDLMAEYINSNRLTIAWTEAPPDGKLVIFDKFINYIILEGFVVESMAVNPQIRACVKHYGENILFRSLRRQTDRQTHENNIPELDITNADETQTETASQGNSEASLHEEGEVDGSESSEGSLF